MKILCLILHFWISFVICRDFYIGMFKHDDYLVAQDVVFKDANPFGYTMASYGRLFKCPITFFRVVDRLGMGRGPYTTVVRGGLGKKYINVRIRSTYKLPVSVNIYVGCENKEPRVVKFPKQPPKARTKGTEKNEPTTTTDSSSKNETSPSDPSSRNETDPAAPDPANPDPANPDPANPDPANPDPAKPDPAKPDPAKPDPAKPDPAKPDPANPNPDKPDPVNPPPGN
ncbi:ejaculatory bulb-specific protein 1-like [Spodoptera litura]|uniref:Ejaculatory bulb-specific protein 1-like n=1 Tax=Spodoptera litura TaxID=69820 RepID=A0A9J7EF12_SPOLT|nr:ejaculatory bulb-specific protein 1-like [Spodoptera litura]